jgi:hypothetical protein
MHPGNYIGDNLDGVPVRATEIDSHLCGEDLEKIVPSFDPGEVEVLDGPTRSRLPDTVCILTDEPRLTDTGCPPDIDLFMLTYSPGDFSEKVFASEKVTATLRYTGTSDH